MLGLQDLYSNKSHFEPLVHTCVCPCEDSAIDICLTGTYMPHPGNHAVLDKQTISSKLVPLQAKLGATLCRSRWPLAESTSCLRYVCNYLTPLSSA